MDTRCWLVGNQLVVVTYPLIPNMLPDLAGCFVCTAKSITQLSRCMRVLTPFEIELLRKSKREMAARFKELSNG